MRISELAERTGVPVATVKYYLREGLLPQGRVTSRTQAEYDEEHVQRLRLLRVLREVGDVPVSRLRDLVAAVEAEGLTTHDVLGAAAEALAPDPPAPGPLRELARQVASGVVRDAGWTRVRPASADHESLAAAIEALMVLGTPEGQGPEALQPYVDAVDRLARYEIGALDDSAGPEDVMQQMVVGQVVLGRVLVTLRRLAEEHHSAERFDPVPPRRRRTR